MRLTKLGHACVRIEHDGAVVVLDPGMFTDPDAVDGATAVLITHEHPDHYLPDHLRRTDAPIWTIADVAARIREDAPDVAERVTVVSPGEQLDVGLPVRVVGELHAVIHPELPRFHNSGYVVTAGDTSVYHPGDALTEPGQAVDVLLPAGQRAVDAGLRGRRLRPRGRRPRATSRSTTGSTPRPASASSTGTSTRSCRRRGSTTSGSPTARSSEPRGSAGGERVAHRHELRLRLGELGLGVGVGDDAAAGEEPDGRAVELGRAQGDAPLAVAGGVHPADRAGVAAAVHALDLGDQVGRDRRWGCRRRRPRGAAPRRAAARRRWPRRARRRRRRWPGA